MSGDEGALDVTSALLALIEGAEHGRGPAGVTTMLVETADELLDVAAGAVTGGPEGVDRGSLVLSRHDPGGAVAAAFDDGPGSESVRSGRSVMCDDVSSERARWLRFAAKAGSGGVGGAWAVPIRRGDESMGTLLLLDVSGRGRPDLGLASTLAEAAAVGLRHAHALHRAEAVGHQLQEALRSRVVIEQAKGALALHAGLDVEEAFAVLRRHARSRGLGLTDLARRVVAGEVDLSTVARSHPPVS